MYRAYRQAMRRSSGRSFRPGRRGGLGGKIVAGLAGLVLAAGVSAAGAGAGAAIGHHFSTPSCTSPAGNVQLGQCLAAGDGWTGSQWPCLYALWNQESGWSATATNQTSGAFGIAQSLHGSPGDEYNPSDPQGLTPGQLAAANAGSAYWQMVWGLAYIASAYGTPCGAWDHETADGWY
jgi:hypothetical protein